MSEVAVSFGLYERAGAQLRAYRALHEALLEQDFVREARWVDEGLARLSESLAGWSTLRDKLLMHPELHKARAVVLRERRLLLLDRMEAIKTSLVEIAGEGSPILEVLFKGLKIPNLRRPNEDMCLAWVEEFQRRTDSSYVVRMVREPQARFEAAAARFEAWQAAVGAWRTLAFPEDALVESDCVTELLQTSGTLSRTLEQAEHLAQAALLSEVIPPESFQI